MTVSVRSLADLLAARNAVRKLAEDVGFSTTLQVKLTTAVSEIVRNVLNYAGNGGCVARKTINGIRVEVWDTGPGIPLETIQAIEQGVYVSTTGMGKGIAGSKRLMDTFTILSSPGNTQVIMELHLR